MKTTHDLLSEYLDYLKPDYAQLKLDDYELNGSVIKITYHYNPLYDWDNDYTINNEKEDFELLDYITWLNQK